MRKKSIVCGVVLGLGFALAAQADLAVTSVLTQTHTDAKPQLALAGDTLVAAQMNPNVLSLISTNDSGAAVRTLPDAGGVNYLSASESGWVAVCENLGEMLWTFNSADPSQSHQVDFSNRNDLNCGSVTFADSGTSDDGTPLVWLGAVGEQKIALYDVEADSTQQLFSPISGPFSIATQAGNIFSISGTVLGNATDMPLILNASTGNVLVGNAMGDDSQTPLKREFSSIVQPDPQSGLVFYYVPARSELDGFVAASPSVQTMQKVALHVQDVRSIGRYGSCLGVLGTDAQMNPQWEVLQAASTAPTFQSLSVTPVATQTLLQGSAREVIAPNGTAYVVDSGGVSAVQGLFDSLPCQ